MSGVCEKSASPMTGMLDRPGMGSGWNGSILGGEVTSGSASR